LYGTALDALRARGLLYPCYCTRKELRAIAGAPHVDDAGAPYPGLCRTLSAAGRKRHEEAGRRPSWRLVCPADTVWTFEDAIMGPQARTLEECGGDFALRRSDGVYAYQLAVVVDDIAMGVTQVTRGSDILCSTPRQMYLYSLFGAPAPRYAHVPLVTDCAGERLAKRHQALTLRSLRDGGVFPETLVGWLASSSGLIDAYRPMSAEACLRGFSCAKIRQQPFRLPPDPLRYFLALQ
jgi:glutamyl-tRNA synthetase